METSPFATKSFLTDAIRPPRSSLFSSSFALPCPLEGTCMNSNGIYHFPLFEKPRRQGLRPCTPDVVFAMRHL